MPADFFNDLTTQPHVDSSLACKYFDGSSWKVSISGKTSTVLSPADASLVGTLQVVTHAEIDEALTKAKKAQTAWEHTPLHARIKIIHLASDWIRQFEEYLTALLMREVGKTHDDAKSEILRTADLMDYFADEAQSIKGETLDSDNFPGFDKGRIALIERAAQGVVLCIAPFNYPINLAASKIAPALLMGNAVVFKPPTQGGIIGTHLTQAFVKAGVPEGVISCLTGGGAEIGDYLVSHPMVDMVAFTGSSETGVAIATKAPMKPLLFECGGNNPSIVLPDADMTLTARELVKGSFSYSGQRCTAIKYVLATSEVMEKVIPAVEKTMDELIHEGDSRSPETKMVGPVVSEKVAQEIMSVIEEAKTQGAVVLRGGTRKGAIVSATLLKNVTPTMNIVAKEIFGPVLSFITVKDTAEAVSIVNASTFGLQASVFTKDEGTGLVVAGTLNTGTVQINGSPQRGPDHFPFLGIKHSGVGVQGVRYSLEAMSRLRPIVINKPS